MKAPVYHEGEFPRLRFDGYEPVARAGDGFQDWLAASYEPGPLVFNALLARYVGPEGSGPPVGLQLGVPSGSADWLSSGTLNDEDLARQGGPDWRYSVELYEEHVARVVRHAQRLCVGAGAGGQTDHAVALDRVDTQYGLEPGTALRAIALAAQLHDTGKLTQCWQDRIWQWQVAKASCGANYPSGPQSEERYERANQLLRRRSSGECVFLAHSDFDSRHTWPNGLEERTVAHKHRRPPHALEGAWLSLSSIAAALPRVELIKTVSGAIAQHHTPSAGHSSNAAPDVRLGNDASTLLARVLQGAWRPPEGEPDQEYWERFLSDCVRRELKPGSSDEDWDWWPVAMLCVRIVRLADQAATAEGST